MTLLRIEDLDVHYGDFQALSGVSLSVDHGGSLALVGANGAGKSTLLRTIAGAHPATGGRITLDGTGITTAPPHHRVRAGIALVPEGRRLFPSLTAEENIKVGGRAWPLDRVYDVFPLIARCRNRRAALLSGGEQQAVAIARALASGPRLLLLDEISLGLAPAVVDDLYDVLAVLRAEGTALVLVEQDLARARAAGDHLICLLEGRVVLATAAADAPLEKVISAYFGTSQ
ncbi:ABC transporter ATP-binding protein [Actinoplanes sp. NPDC051851]|uniref:ABC transporter ATP-binding protein n=1 Tax=Actinoplanes sp. NPDC051851 TaxID=3154753 RepID=UPI00341B731D